MRVLAGWQSDSTFRQKGGRPRPLCVEGKNSFRTLVEKYAGDVTHVALLRELERLQWVRRNAAGLIAIQRRPSDVRQRTTAVETFAARIADYASALGEPSSVVEKASYAGHRESLPTHKRVGAALTRIFSRRAEEFLDSFERWVSRSRKQSGATGDSPTAKYGIGVYLVERKVDDTKIVAHRVNSRAKRA
jgi:hypothetical protein